MQFVRGIHGDGWLSRFTHNSVQFLNADPVDMLRLKKLNTRSREEVHFESYAMWCDAFSILTFTRNSFVEFIFVRNESRPVLRPA